MARALLVALWCATATTAACSRYGDYAGARMPQYGAPEYDARGAPAHEPDDYRGHSPDAPAALDYKYEEELAGALAGKTDQTPVRDERKDVEESDSWQRSDRRHKKSGRSAEEQPSSSHDRFDPEDDFPKAKTSHRYFTKHRPRLKSRKYDTHDETEKYPLDNREIHDETQGNPISHIDKHDDIDSIDNEESVATEDYRNDKRNGLEGKSRHSRRERVARRKPRDKFDRESERGLGRGLDSSLGRGLDRGLDRDLDKELDRGLESGIDRGLESGVDRGLVSGIDRGLSRGLERRLENIDRGLDRGFDRGLDRRLDAGLDKAMDRGLDREGLGGMGPGLGRGFDKESDRGSDTGSDKGLEREDMGKLSDTDIENWMSMRGGLGRAPIPAVDPFPGLDENREGRRRPDTPIREPAQRKPDGNDEILENLRSRKGKLGKKIKNYQDYNDYYDMKRVNNYKNKLPSLLRRTTVREEVTPAALEGSSLLVLPDPSRSLHELLSRRLFLPPTPALRSTLAPPEPPTAPTPTHTTHTTSTVPAVSTTKPPVTTSVPANNITELSLAEKSRLSILKKAMRKESEKGGITTKKPPVLLQVTQNMPTVVMVEPPSSEPFMRAREVFADSPARLDRVKRLMRHKLVANARNIHDLTDNWDDLVCDYIDMSLLENMNAAVSISRYSSLCLIPVILTCWQ